MQYGPSHCAELRTLPKRKFPELDLPVLEFSTPDFSALDFPGLDLPGLDLPGLDFPGWALLGKKGSYTLARFFGFPCVSKRRDAIVNYGVINAGTQPAC